jgi:hypothetical protein
MASIITATTTSGLTQSADNSGVLQLASGVGNLVTVPSVTGTAMVSGNMPAFAVYISSNFSTATSTATKIPFNTELFDTNSNFDSTTNYRFTPTVAGYYQISLMIAAGFSAATGLIYGSIYKNGSEFVQGIRIANNTANAQNGSSSVLMYLNGSTDYVEFYGFQNTGSTQSATFSSGTSTQATGVLVRTA